MTAIDPVADLQSEAVGKTEKYQIPGLADFTKLLLAGSLREDIETISPSGLAEIAFQTYQHFQSRRPGPPKIAVFNPPSPFEGVTAINIVNDDMPFLVDSILALLNEKGMEIKLLLHPVLMVKRDAVGNVLSARDGRAALADMSRESCMRLHVTRLESTDALSDLSQAIEQVLADVRTTVIDWRAMTSRLKDAIEVYRRVPPPVPVEDLTEAIAFLQWLLDNHFTFLGMREYCFQGGIQKGSLEIVPETGLGILRDSQVGSLKQAEDASISPEVRDFLMQPIPLIITKSEMRADVHRRVPMDCISLKLFDNRGELSGELRVLGLFTSSAYTQSPHEIPLLRRKLRSVLVSSGYSPDSHSGKALNNVLENYPRDELFQIDVRKLSEIASGILQLDERPRTRLFIRQDRFDRFVSAFVYIPRDRFNTEVRLRVGELLASAFGGTIQSFAPSFSETTLVRVHFIIARNSATPPIVGLAELERQVTEAVKNWDDRLSNALLDAGYSARIARWSGAFPPAYTSRISPEEAIRDITEIDQLRDASEVAVEFIPGSAEEPHRCRLKLYRNGQPVPLSARLPILENMGFRSISETTYELSPASGRMRTSAVVHDVLLERADDQPARLAELGKMLEEAFLATWTGKAENDAFNSLVLLEGLSWREISILRAAARFLRQASAVYSAEYMSQTLLRHPAFARNLIRLFVARLDPARPPADVAENLQARILTDLEQIPSLDDDTIIRRYLNLIASIQRTNYFQEGPPATLSIKIASRNIEGLPEPRPFAEIFVYSPDVEGVHLRGGPIARGGLRWSDRPEDFRTEVLGLAKAQNVKNAVIVPVGAKGGFVPKKLPIGSAREQVQAEAVRAYKLFVSSLLDLTDNISAAEIVPPPNTARLDGDDPYLVVAADKGTATFSDIANGLSEDRHFWLGDAFASGGSAGYDHKKMGITARGAWEALKRHFREIDMDIQTTPFNVIGVGDMSGDVFGNGMLLSPCIKLIAAFDHRDIFIDPSPDPATSLAERRRLFELPRSSWQDYDKTLISKGGGVFSRQSKAIPLSMEIRNMTGLSGASATPQILMRALLKASADLLWFGGIGTYVKASDETNAETGDRANDAIRIDASDVRARVIGEGANLAVTQRARVEFALKDGRINTDAVDNAAGVNTSDVEVNIKIALSAAEQAGRLARPDRNRLLADMTDEVAVLVLRNNYLQTLCISLAVARGSEGNGYAMELMNVLEGRKLLDRSLEALPSDTVILERDSKGLTLTRPEYAVLMAYAKLTLSHDLVASDVPDDPYLSRELMRYFPSQMKIAYAPEIETHQLRREIIATLLANSMINRGGPYFVSRLTEETGASAARIAAGFAVARDSFGFTALNARVDELDNRIPGALQIRLHQGLQVELTWATQWYVRHERLDDGLDRLIARYGEGIHWLERNLVELVGDDARSTLLAAVKSLETTGVPVETARRLASGSYLQRAPDIVHIANQTGQELGMIARALFASAETLRINAILDQISTMTASSFVERRAINRLVGQLFQTHRAIVTRVVHDNAASDDKWGAWRQGSQAAVSKALAVIDQLLSDRKFDLARLAVAQGTLADLTLR